MKILIVLAACVTLAACTSGASTGAMIVPVSQDRIIDAASPLKGAIQIAGVTGGKKTNPMWMSKVSDEAFMEALRQSLAVHTMLGGADAKYKLNAELMKLKQPIAGFNMTVKATVKYVLTEAASGQVVFDRTIETPYTAKMGDAFVGAKRLQLANEGAIRENIQAFLRALIDEAKTNPALAGLLPGGEGQLALARLGG